MSRNELHPDVQRAIAAGAEDALEQLARLRPETLAGAHDALLDADLLSPAIAFRTAGEAARERLLAAVRAYDGQTPERNTAATLELDALLSALAWIGDSVVQACFSEWRSAPPSWRSAVYLAPEDYSVVAGWELTPAGTRRDLFRTEGWIVSSGSDSSSERGTTLLGSGGPPCTMCGGPLGKLFDLDSATATQLATAGLLALPFCHGCSEYGDIWFQVRGHEATWHPQNRPFPRYDEYHGPWNEGRLGLGRPLANTFELAGWTDEQGHLGGFPGWIQDPTFPPCPDCGERATFVGQVDVSSGGRFYGLACFECGNAVTHYQQT